jgi:hypothetical protein
MRLGSHCRTERLPHRRLRRLLLAGYDRTVRLSTTGSLAGGSLRKPLLNHPEYLHRYKD